MSHTTISRSLRRPDDGCRIFKTETQHPNISIVGQVNRMVPSRPHRETSFGRRIVELSGSFLKWRTPSHRAEGVTYMEMSWNCRSARFLGIVATVATSTFLGIGTSVSTALAHSPQAGFSPFGGFSNSVVFNGAEVSHTISGGSEQLTKPDDITLLDGHVFVAFQNGVGPQGEASPTGNADSTVVELDPWGHPLNQWDLTGKCDGLTADPATDRLIATVNEDANSSLYTIDPKSAEAIHYSYNEPLPSDGGTDAISIYHGMILISASAPGTTGAPAPQASYPAVYQVELNASTQVANIHPLFGDEATATEANIGTGAMVKLALTDPDSNEVVPFYARRFAGDFMLTSQGDEEQVFVKDAGGPDQTLSVLKLTSSVDDTAWPSTPWGSLYVTDNSNDTVDRVNGFFLPGEVFVADTPCDENSAPSTCPGPGFPSNFLGELDPWTGAIAPLTLFGPAVQPQGMLFVP